MTAQNLSRTTPPALVQTRGWSDKIVQGCVALTHNGMALLGTSLALSAALLLTQPELRHDAEQQLLGWLQQRQTVATAPAAAFASTEERPATVTSGTLPRQQEQIVWVNRAVSDTLQLLDFDAQSHGVEQHLELAVDDLRDLADDSDLRMVVLNLAQNAHHAMPQGGSLT